VSKARLLNHSYLVKNSGKIIRLIYPKTSSILINRILIHFLIPRFRNKRTLKLYTIQNPLIISLIFSK